MPVIETKLDTLVDVMRVPVNGDPALARMKPPLTALPAADRNAVTGGYDAIRARRAA